MSLLDLGQKITLYSCACIFITGLSGNGIMIFIFSSNNIYRTTPCTFYLLISSICNILYILVNLPIRFFAVVYGIDITDTSAFLCKGRTFITGWLTVTSFSCSCMTIIDQFFVTSRKVSLRQCSQIKWTYRIVFIFIIIWFVHAIPAFIFLDISPISKTCMTINSNYATYISIYILVLISAIPVLIMIIFGYLTYRNIHQTIVLAGQHVDRLMTTMTFIQVILIIISNSPFGIFYAYSLITVGFTKTFDQQIKEAFIAIIFSLISYFYYVGNFYMFLIISTRFRQTVKDRIFRRHRPNQIIPIRQFHV